MSTVISWCFEGFWRCPQLFLAVLRGFEGVHPRVLKGFGGVHPRLFLGVLKGFGGVHGYFLMF